MQLDLSAAIRIVPAEYVGGLQLSGTQPKPAERRTELVDVDGARLVNIVAHKGLNGAHKR